MKALFALFFFTKKHLQQLFELSSDNLVTYFALNLQDSRIAWHRPLIWVEMSQDYHPVHQHSPKYL